MAMVPLHRVQWPDLLKAVPYSCSRKAAMSYDTAKAEAERLNRVRARMGDRQGPPVGAYFCPTCGEYHVGKRVRR